MLTYVVPILYHLGVYNVDFTFYDTNRVWVFESFLFYFILFIPFGFAYHARTSNPR
jgi:hypothetical protein